MISNTWNDRAQAVFMNMTELAVAFHREVIAECNARGASHPLAQEAIAAEHRLWSRPAKTAVCNQLGMTDDPLAQSVAKALRETYGSKEVK